MLHEETDMQTSHTEIPEARPLPRAAYPFDAGFYGELIDAHGSFKSLSEQRTEKTGLGFRVSAGNSFRLTTLEKAQIVDMCFVNADDPEEHYFSGTQQTIEGGKVTRGMRLWGSPPLSRPLATCIADTVRVKENSKGMRDHLSTAGHCNVHLWQLYTHMNHRPCYDNMRYGFSMLGMSQLSIYDNLNLFQKGAYDRYTGVLENATSDIMRGDYIEFFAEVNLAVSISLCPNGSGSGGLRESWSESGVNVPVHPVAVTTYETGKTPLPWSP